MKKSIWILLSLFLTALSGCGDPYPRAQSAPDRAPNRAPRQEQGQEQGEELGQEQEKARPLTPEESLGLRNPNRLAASVEAWAKSNELGDYFRQSRERLAKLRAELVEDFNVRKESDLEPTAYTKETLGKYNETYEADVELVKFMVECYSRKEVRPLPDSISRHFTTAIADRGETRAQIKDAPDNITRLQTELDNLKSEFDMIGPFAWTQEKELSDWNDIQTKVSDISARASKASSQAASLAANLSKAASSEMSEEVYVLRDQADQLKTDLSNFSNRITQQLAIVNGQILLTKFANNCNAVIDGMTTVPNALANKKKRMAEMKDVTSKLTSSRNRGFSDLSTLDQQVTTLKARSQTEGEKEEELGRRVQKLAGNYQKVFGSSAIYRLKKELPEESARAQIDACLSSLKSAINVASDADLSSVFTNLESKSYQLSDRMEEEALLKRLDETLTTVKRLAARGR